MFFKNDEFELIKKETSFLYWWQPKSRLRVIPRAMNVGDALSAYIVWHVIQEKKIKLVSGENKLLSIGSILNHANTGDTLWGTGFNSNKTDTDYDFANLTVCAVRGPCTKKFLENKGISCPAIYGDPGLLTSRYFAQAAKQDIDLLVIPHYSESKTKYSAKHVLETKGSVPKFIDKLTRAKKVVSSSLHGIIMAESYGIPAILLKNANGEGEEKYHDYYQGTGRFEFPICSTLKEAMSSTPCELPDIKKIQQDLINSFPNSL